MIERIQNWDKNSYPPKASEVVEHDEFKALPPAGKIDTLNKLQAQWADVSSVDNKEDYPGIMRDMETWFGDQRKAIVKDGLAEDLAAGKLTQQQVQAYVTQGPDALDDAGKQHFMGRYGDPKALVGPWVTTKAPIVGADGKPVGFQYIRRRPGMTGQAIAENMGIPGDQWNQAGYVMHNAGAQEPLTWKNPDSADNIEVSWTVNGNDGKQYSGVEQVSGGEQFSRLADAQRSLAVYQGMGDPGMAGPSRETADLANLPDMVGSEGLPSALASDAVSRRLQSDPEIAKKIGQGLLAGLPGEATKGFLNFGASALYGPQALFGNKQAARDYQQAVKDVDATIEGQSRAGFEGGMLNNALKSASGEAIPMLFSMGTGLVAGGVRKLAQGATEAATKAFIESAATTPLKQAPALLKSLSGGLGKLIGTAELKSDAAKMISDRVLNAVAFLPSSMRGGLDNMATALDTADDLRRQGKTKEADAVEDNATSVMLAGTALETLSENMWVNEMMVTKAGRPFSEAITASLNRKLGPKMGKVADFFAKTLTGANQEGIEEIVSGVGNSAWMNAYAEQNKDVFGDIPSDYLGGAIMGGIMEGAKMLKGEKAKAFANATTQNLQHDPEAASTLAEIRAKAEEIAANPKPEVATPETPAESISSAPPPAPGDATLQTSPVAPVPVEPAGAGPSPELSIASGAESADVPTTPIEAPKAFAPIAPLPESKTADEVAKTLHDARSEAIDVANEASSIPGAEVTAEALASIAADEEATFLDVEAARSGLARIGEQVAPAEVAAPEPISPDGDVATPPTEEAAPVAKTAAESAIATAADAVDSEKVSKAGELPVAKESSAPNGVDTASAAVSQQITAAPIYRDESGNAWVDQNTSNSESEPDAQEALSAMRSQDGFVGGRVYRTTKKGEGPWVTQAFFSDGKRGSTVVLKGQEKALFGESAGNLKNESQNGRSSASVSENPPEGVQSTGQSDDRTTPKETPKPARDATKPEQMSHPQSSESQPEPENFLEQAKALRQKSARLRKEAADYNRSTGGAAVANKGRNNIHEMNRGGPGISTFVSPMSENRQSARHRELIAEADKALSEAVKLEAKAGKEPPEKGEFTPVSSNPKQKGQGLYLNARAYGESGRIGVSSTGTNYLVFDNPTGNPDIIDLPRGPMGQAKQAFLKEARKRAEAKRTDSADRNKSEAKPAENNENPSAVTEPTGTIPVTLNSVSGKSSTEMTGEQIQSALRDNKFLESALKSLIDCLK